MKILGLRAENIKKLKVVEIKPNGNVIKLTGANEQGKSSILDSITMALGGTKMVPEKPIREGQTSASTTLDLGDLTVTRQFTLGSDSLVVKNKDGAKYPSPQSMLDSFIGRLSFDPLDFITNEKKQVETLLQVVNIPVDCEYLSKLSGFKIKVEINPIDSIDHAVNLVKQNRSEVNRELTRDKKTLESYGTPAKAESVVIKDLFNEKEQITKQLELVQSQKIKFQSLATQIDSDEKECERIKEQIKILQNNLDQKIKHIGESKTILSEYKTSIDNTVVPTYTEIDQKIADADRVNAAARKYDEYKVLQEKVEKINDEYKVLGDTLKQLEDYKQKLLTEVQFPIDGLGFSSGTVTYKNLPLAQASSAEQLSIGMAVAMALNPNLRVILIRDASLLDSKHLAVIEQMAKDNDFQVWMEIVDETGEIGIYIEDGSIVTKEDKK